MKEWSIELYVLDQDGKEHPAKCFTKVVFHLHPSFENPDQSKPTTVRLRFLLSALLTWTNSLHRAALQVHQ